MPRNVYINVSQLLREGIELPTPEVLQFSDDFSLFYSGSFNLIYGDTESGKTWLCLAAVASVLEDGGRATVIDLDHNGASALVGNLVKLGVSVETLSHTDCFRHQSQQTGWSFGKWSRTNRPSNLISSSWTRSARSFRLFRANSNSADDFTTVHAEVIKPLTRIGASVLVVDHLAKNADSRSFGPTGTAAKMRAADGLTIRVTAEKQFTPGEGGKAKLQVYKAATAACANTIPVIPSPSSGLLS